MFMRAWIHVYTKFDGQFVVLGRPFCDQFRCWVDFCLCLCRKLEVGAFTHANGCRRKSRNKVRHWTLVRVNSHAMCIVLVLTLAANEPGAFRWWVFISLALKWSCNASRLTSIMLYCQDRDIDLQSAFHKILAYCRFGGAFKELGVLATHWFCGICDSLLCVSLDNTSVPSAFSH